MKSSDPDFLHVWCVSEAVPQQKIAYDWKYADYAGDALVVFELSRHGDQTKLRLTCNVRWDFPDVIPEFTRKSCIVGWEYFTQKSLKEYLEEDR